MNLLHWTAAAASLLALAACQPPAADYTSAEWPKALILDKATGSLAVRFLPGSDRLFPEDMARLRRLAARGQLAPSDRVLVAAGGPPRLAASRFGAVSRTLMAYGIVATPTTLPVPGDTALVEGVRYLVTLPKCPNWSKPPAADYANTVDSNFGCATAVNLGAMAASPADLAEGRRLGPAPAITEVSAVGRYYADRVFLAPSISLITSLGNTNEVPPGVQTPLSELSPMFIETAPVANPIGAAGMPGPGGGDSAGRPAVPGSQQAGSQQAGSQPAGSQPAGSPGLSAPVPPGSVPPPGR